MISGDIADAVVTLIAGAVLNQTVAVERQWVETMRLEGISETDPAKIIVVPRILNVAPFDLKPRMAFHWDIGIWLDKKVVQQTTQYCDPVAELVEEIVMLLVTNRDLSIGSSGRARLMQVTPHPTYDAIQLLDIRVFRSVFLATYRVTQ